MPAAMPNRRCSASPACPRRGRLAALDAARAVRRRGRRLGRRRRCCWRRTGPTALLLQSLQPLPDQDWVRLTQSQFEPVAIADGFWVVPSWHEVPAGAQRVIRLDPGLAFGTGTHPTTRMCLRWLAAQAATLAAPGARVLDYGCGSGILAIGAALHGAARHRRRGHRPGRGAGHRGQRRRQRRAAARRPAAGHRRPLRRGAGQHPGHAAEAAGTAAVRAAAARAATWCWPASWSARPTN